MITITIVFLNSAIVLRLVRCFSGLSIWQSGTPGLDHARAGSVALRAEYILDSRRREDLGPRTQAQRKSRHLDFGLPETQYDC